MSSFFKTTQGKVILFMLTVILLGAVILSTTALVTMVVTGFYSNTIHRVYKDLASSYTMVDGREALLEKVDPDHVNRVTDWNNDTNLVFEITKESGQVVFQTEEQPAEWEYTYHFGVWWINDTVEYIAIMEGGETVEESMEKHFYAPSTKEGHGEYFYFKAAIKESLPVQDGYATLDRIVNLGYRNRYLVIILTPVLLLLALASLVALIALAGRRNEDRDVHPGFFYKTPLDLILLLIIGIGLVFGFVGSYVSYHSYSGGVVVLVVSILAGVIALSGLSMTISVRIQLGTFWSNNLSVSLFKGIRAGSGKIFRSIRKLLDSRTILSRVFLAIFMIILIKAALLTLSIVFSIPWLFVVGTLGIDLIIAIFVLVISLHLREIEKAGEALSSGQLDYQIQTDAMPQMLRHHCDDMNNIGLITQKAVDDQVMTERSKTELITNVSHDLKTPLTSVINYATLIGNHPSTDPEIKEYSEVLVRQSTRLKHLIDDLVDVSRAQAGNLDVNLELVDVGVLIDQMVGEFDEKLKNADLTLITSLPNEPVEIMLDGRRIWRVFDNLMTNICKYSLPGTRVFLTVESLSDLVQIIFKNTSREPLDLSGEKLMERFVRADKARNTEGSGLGIPIAKSMTEIQGGIFALEVDGDLFKTTLTFARPEPSPDEAK
ncbi:MAG: HAMP domain-containing histidine kinase [Clostridia bacterium]|nr:HAMP domain-containing histidine kinase [Clostridia bacterium]